MTEVERIKEILKKDKNFRKNFLGVKNIKTAVAIARSKGFGITKDDILSDNELSNSLLKASAGGEWEWYDYIASAVCPIYGAGKVIVEVGKELMGPRTTIINNITNNNNNINAEINGDGNNPKFEIHNDNGNTKGLPSKGLPFIGGGNIGAARRN